MTVNILSSHRLLPGFGLAGGEAGKLGINKLYRANGSYVQLDGQSQLEVAVGDTLSIATPGGGGYGQA